MGSMIEHPTNGRPRLLAPEYERELTSQTHVAATRRAQRRHYAMVAARALFDLDQSEWVPRDAVFAHFVKRNGDLKWSMLSELGRIDDEETLQAVARIVGRQCLPTARATALIRRIRIGDCPPQPDRLPRGLLAVIATHCARYPTTSEAEIVTALEAAAAAVHRDSTGCKDLPGFGTGMTGSSADAGQ